MIRRTRLFRGALPALMLALVSCTSATNGTAPTPEHPASTTTAPAAPAAASYTPTPEGGLTALSEAEMAKLRLLLPDRIAPLDTMTDDRSEHVPSRGHIGPFADAILVLTESDADSSLHAIILAFLEDGTLRVVASPLLHNGYCRLTAVFAADADPDPDVELVVVADYMPGVGPEAAHCLPRVHVVDWDASVGEFAAREETPAEDPMPSVEELRKRFHAR